MNWVEYIKEYVTPPQKRDALIKYAEKLESNAFPVILNFYHLSLVLGLQPGTLSAIVNSSGNFYRTFKIPKKRSGQFREINSPYPVLKEAQDWIKSNILDKIEPHEKCFSYRKNFSIINNASEHLEAYSLYKIDLQDFFPSIKIGRIITIFQKCGYSKKVSYYLSCLCMINNEELPQGASTSPTISNIIGKRLDRRLVGLSSKFKLKYSRYADDMTFSGRRITRNFRISAYNITESEGFKINPTKEILIIGLKKKKIVTGISVSNGNELKIPREMKRNIKLDVHKYLKYNYKVNIDKQDFDPLFGERLLGRLNFWYQIERDNPKVKDLISSVRLKMNNL